MPSQDAFLNVERGLAKWSRKRKGTVFWGFLGQTLVGSGGLRPALHFRLLCPAPWQSVWVSLLPVVLGPGQISSSSLLFLVRCPSPPCGYSPGLSLTGKLASWCQCLLRMPCLGWAEPHLETGAPGPCPALPHCSSWGAAVHAHQEHLETNSILTVGLQEVAGLKVIRGTRARYHGHVAGEKGADGGLSSQGQ